MLNTTIFFLIGVALAGYVHLSTSLHYKFKVPYYQGHHLLFRAILSGVFWNTISALLVWLFVNIDRDLTSSLSKNVLVDFFHFVFPSKDKSTLKHILIIIQAVSLSWLTAQAYNLYHYILVFISSLQDELRTQPQEYKVNKPGRTLKDKFEFMRGLLDEAKKQTKTSFFLDSNNSDIMEHIILSWEQHTPLLFTLNNRKCYVGIPYKVTFPMYGIESGKEVTILPYSSGYRDKDDLAFHITAEYPDVQEFFEATKETEEGYNDEDYIELTELESVELIMKAESYRASFSLDEISSIATFDLDEYHESLKKELNMIKKIKIRRQIEQEKRFSGQRDFKRKRRPT